VQIIQSFHSLHQQPHHRLSVGVGIESLAPIHYCLDDATEGEASGLPYTLRVCKVIQWEHHVRDPEDEQTENKKKKKERQTHCENVILDPVAKKWAVSL
jgi:hypothetical protein